MSTREDRSTVVCSVLGRLVLSTISVLVSARGGPNESVVPNQPRLPLLTTHKNQKTKNKKTKNKKTKNKKTKNQPRLPLLTTHKNLGIDAK